VDGLNDPSKELYLPEGSGEGGVRVWKGDLIKGRDCRLEIDGEIKRLTCPGGQATADGPRPLRPHRPVKLHHPSLHLAAALAVGALAAARAQQPAGAANPYGFEVWYADYPVELPLSPQVPMSVYERSRRQALEQVAANLQGNVSRAAWQMAMDFFDRAPAD